MPASAIWTTPRDWAAGEVVTAAQLNSHLRNNLQFLWTAVGCRVFHSTTQDVANNTSVYLAFDSERFDTSAFHSTSTNTSRLTVPTGMGGLYLIGANIVFPSNATGLRDLAIRLNGSTIITVANEAAVSGAATYMALATVYQLAAGDYVELRAFQSSGGTLTIPSPGTVTTEFFLARL